MPERVLTARQVVQRLYGPGGPKEGVRFRRDYAEKREIAWRALLRWSYGQRGGPSGRWGTTFAQLIASMHTEMAALEAKPWQPPPTSYPVVEGNWQLNSRHEWLAWHYAPFLRTVLEDFRRIGLLEFAGDQDNNNFWFRLIVQLREPPPGRPAPRNPNGPAQPSEGHDRPTGAAGPRRCSSPSRAPLEAERGREPGDARVATGVESDQNSDWPLREPAVGGPSNLESSPHSDFVFSRTGAHATPPTARFDGHLEGANDIEGSAEKPNNGSTEEGESGPSWEDRLAALVDRVAKREELVAPSVARAERQRDQRAERDREQMRAAAVGERFDPNTLIGVYELVRRQPARFSAARHGARLERALGRYERYRDCRPDGWPAAGAAALVVMFERGDHWISGAPVVSLAAYVHQLDRLSRQMRRAYKRSHAGRYDEAARRRVVRRRRQRDEAQRAPLTIAFRRPIVEPELETLQHAYNVVGHDLHRVRDLIGYLAGPEQLRCQLRERYLLEHGRSAGFSGFSQGGSWPATQAPVEGGERTPAALIHGPAPGDRWEDADTRRPDGPSEAVLLAGPRNFRSGSVARRPGRAGRGDTVGDVERFGVGQ